MFEFISTHIHHHPTIVKENEKLTRMVKELYNTFYEDLSDGKNDHGIDRHVNHMIEKYKETPKELIVSDYLSGMTDSYVLRIYEERFLPKQHGEVIDIE